MSNEETIAKLKAARDILAAPGGWTKGLGDEDGATCALGALGRVYDFKEDEDKGLWWGTDEIIEWLAEVDGDAVRALGRATPDGPTSETRMKEYYQTPDAEISGISEEEAIFQALATDIFQFNDGASQAEVLDLYDRAIASLGG